jgi:nucleoside-diphosphate-sugar epimerase
LATYLVTGAAGFIGSHLVRALLERGDTVRGFDNFATGRRENLAEIAGEFELIEGDLRDAAAVRAACAGAEYVLHEGALPSVPRSVKDPLTSHAVNALGTLNLLEAARHAGVRRVVYAASSSAYGDQPGFPRVETMTPQPMSPYAVQKLAGEFYLQSYSRVYGLETVALRYFNIFGPRQDPASAYAGVVARWIRELLRGEQPVIFGDGETGRDFTYVANVVQANLKALEASATNVSGRVFNVACGERHTLNEMFRTLADLTGYPGHPSYGPERAGDVRDSLADISAARQAFGYEPEVGFREGLRRTVDWYRGNALESR